jgi:Ca2+-binding RTX toxin-like protein
MPSSFGFDASTIPTAPLLERGLFSKGTAPGVNDPNHYSAVALNQAIVTYGGVDLFQMTLVAGQTYTFDVDNGFGDASSIDLRLDLINQAGTLVAWSDNPTSTDRDPLLSFTARPRAPTTSRSTRPGTTTSTAPSSSRGPAATRATTRSPSPRPCCRSPPALTNLSDTRTYTDTAQRVFGLDGNDTLYMKGGNDIALGGNGDDRIWGGTGADELSGGAGVDRLNGESGNDVLNGGSGDDILNGGTENDSVNGGIGNDLLYGGSGNDFVWGDTGNDSLYGDGGNDRIRGGAGIDTMSGGLGADTFHFLPGEATYDATGYNEDVIRDFDSTDFLDLTDVAWGTLAFRGTGGFTGANQVRINDIRGSTGYQEVQVNLDSDATPEMAFLVRTNTGFTLTAGDFLL